MPETVPLPNRLERLARTIKTGCDQRAALVQRRATDRTDWININIGLATDLAAARVDDNGTLIGNIEFGLWCEANDFGDTVLGHDERAHLIAMASNLPVMREVIEASQSWSIQMIYRANKSRFSSATKTRKPYTRRQTTAPAAQTTAPAAQADATILGPTSQPRTAVASKPDPAPETEPGAEPASGTKSMRKPTDAPDLEKARAYIRDDVAAGHTINRKGVAAAIGVGEHSVQNADLVERGYQEGYRTAQEEMAAGTLEGLALSAQEKLDVHKRRLDRQHQQRTAQLEAEYHQHEAAFQQRVQEALREALDNRVLRSYTEELNHTRAVAAAARNGALTARQYTEVLAILSPNNFSETDQPLTWRRATAMFQLINTPVMKDVLVKAEEAPLPPSAFPRNYADLMAARDRVKAERAEQRARRTRGTDTPAPQH